MNATAYVPATLLQGIGRPDEPARLYLVRLAPYVVLMIVLISRWGVRTPLSLPGLALFAQAKGVAKT